MKLLNQICGFCEVTQNILRFNKVNINKYKYNINIKWTNLVEKCQHEKKTFRM